MLKSGIYDFVICRGGTDMCFVLGFGRKRPDLKQYRISGLTTDLVKFRSGCQKQQVSHFGANYNYDQECKHDDAIHVMKVDMTRIKTVYCMHQ